MKTSLRQQEIYEYVLYKQPVAQSIITQEFKKQYKNTLAARVGISKLLNKLQEQGKIKAKTMPNTGRGFIDKNIWSIKE